MERRIELSGNTSLSFAKELPDSLGDFTDLIVMGGDGTLNYVLNHFKHIDIPLSVIPTGTGNDLAYELLGRLSMDAYIELAIRGRVNEIDAGICNGIYFLNGLGVGFDGWVARSLLAKKFLSGNSVYYLTVIALLFFYRESEVIVEYDGGTYRGSLFMLSAANGPTYGGGFRVAPTALFSDRKLDLLIIEKISLLYRMCNLPIIEKGMHIEKGLSRIQYCKTEKITLRCSKKLQAHLDGEWLEANEFTVQVLPGYLKVRSKLVG